MTGGSMEGDGVPVSVPMPEQQSLHTATAQKEAATWLLSHRKLGKVRPAGDSFVAANTQKCPPEKGLGFGF